MKINFNLYIIMKMVIILIFMYLFFNPNIFSMGGFNLAIDGIVVCRGLSLIFAIYTFSNLIDTIYKDKYYK